jgi:hypothetical protein
MGLRVLPEHRAFKDPQAARGRQGQQVLVSQAHRVLLEILAQVEQLALPVHRVYKA